MLLRFVEPESANIMPENTNVPSGGGGHRSKIQLQKVIIYLSEPVQ